MKILKNKIVALAIAMFFIISMTGSMFLFPNVSAHNPPYQIPTWIFCVSSPNPVGVGQTVTIFWWTKTISLPTTNGIYGNFIRTPL